MILTIDKMIRTNYGIILHAYLNAFKDTYANECDVVSNNSSTSDPIPSCSVQAAASVFDCVEEGDDDSLLVSDGNEPQPTNSSQQEHEKTIADLEMPIGNLPSNEIESHQIGLNNIKKLEVFSFFSYPIYTILNKQINVLGK